MHFAESSKDQLHSYCIKCVAPAFRPCPPTSVDGVISKAELQRRDDMARIVGAEDEMGAAAWQMKRGRVVVEGWRGGRTAIAKWINVRPSREQVPNGEVIEA